jgi:Antitoxin Phd_YefM, type II toxin-antitoxin system
VKSYTFSEARQNFAAVLEQARRDGAVRIQRRDGQSFVLTPEPFTCSPCHWFGSSKRSKLPSENNA